MRKVFLLILMVVMPLWAWGDDSTTFQTTYNDCMWTSVDSTGVEYTHLKFNIMMNNQIFSSNQEIYIVRYHTTEAFRAELVYNEGNENRKTLSIIASEEGAVAAINGAYFDFSMGGIMASANYYKTAVPMFWGGVEYNYGDLLFPFDYYSGGKFQPNVFRCNGYVAFKDGKMSFGYLDRKAWQHGTPDATSKEEWLAKYNSEENKAYIRNIVEGADQFVVCGPLLMLDGVKQPATGDMYWDTRAPRSVIATDSEYTYLITIDGRQSAAGRDGVSIPEVQSIMEWMGIPNALNMDGGGSSTLWTTSTGVLNNPSYRDNQERQVPTAIVIKK